jgi:tRNA (guanine37-N1)-methyltransferase
VLGKIESLEESRVSSGEMYTRPEVYEYRGKNYKVPKVFLSGNHKDLEEYKKKK